MDTLHEEKYALMILSHSVTPRIVFFSDKRVDKTKHILFPIFFPPKILPFVR
jgi:hypothetical protein